MYVKTFILGTHRSGMSIVRSCDLRSPSKELEGLKKLFKTNGDGEIAKKVVTVLLVSLWSIITLLLTVEAVDAVQPPFYGILTAIIFLIVGRMWGIEVEKLISEK